MRQSCIRTLALLAIALTATSVKADVWLPSIFGNHMVVQRDQAIVVWGKADPGEKVSVSIEKLTGETTTGKDGRWKVKLGTLPVGGPHTLTVTGKNTVTFEDVLVGEVWICSGQSNMQWSVGQSNDPDLESMTAKYPKIRLISVPQVGTQEAQDDFKGEWAVCTPETVSSFSAVGYFFGRTLHHALDGIPIGLIDNAWGGSAAEAWIRRDVLEADEQFKPLLDRWDAQVAAYDPEKVAAVYEKQLAAWKEKAKEARAAGKPVPREPRRQRDPRFGNHRPANIFNGVLNPTIGYGIRGAIWYQGESNAGRAYQYRAIFPTMIKHWREVWGQGDFPFYWVQLADFRDEVSQPGDSSWAELREAQTMTLRLPNTGQAVITDLGEAHDIHPKDKQNVAKRLARWALAKDYGKQLVYRSPEYKSVEIKGNKAIVTFDHVGGGMDTFDVRTPIGFTIAGEDKTFVSAQARIVGKDRVEVFSPSIKAPVAVRYAWADNPVCNVQNKEGLQLTPFRTDDWPGITIDAK